MNQTKMVQLDEALNDSPIWTEFEPPWSEGLDTYFPDLGNLLIILLFMSFFSNDDVSHSLRNPNYLHSFSRRMLGVMPAWPMYLSSDDGDNYKEFTASLPTLKGLKKADCSFWSDYITRLKASTGEKSVFQH